DLVDERRTVAGKKLEADFYGFQGRADFSEEVQSLVFGFNIQGQDQIAFHGEGDVRWDLCGVQGWISMVRGGGAAECSATPEIQRMDSMIFPRSDSCSSRLRISWNWERHRSRLCSGRCVL